MKNFVVIFCVWCLSINANCQLLLSQLKSPVIFRGNDTIAFRDPAVLFLDGVFYLFFTLVETESNGKIFSYTAASHSSDLINWSSPKKITTRDQNLNYCSPGNVIRFGNEWILCLQTYPRPNHCNTQPVRYGNQNARIFYMRSKDLVNWGEPELMMVKGSAIPEEKMGRMIDPYLLEDKDEQGKFWCFYKQEGVSMSWSYDLVNWTFQGRAEAGENVCVLTENNEYIMFHSPKNGIDILKSNDLKKWQPMGESITLGQKEWDWARGRITAGVVINLKATKGIEKYIMFFHGSGPLSEQEGDFDKNASIGIAWSNDLIYWEYPK